MPRFKLRAPLLAALLVVVGQSAAGAGDLPTADEILRIHRLNEERLTKLHLQLKYRFESTNFAGRTAQKRLTETERLSFGVSQLTASNAWVKVDGKEIKGEAALQIMKSLVSEKKEEAEVLRQQTRAFESNEVIEFFRDGDDYQVRTPVPSQLERAKLAAWKFPEEPLTKDTLLTTYRDISIFSRSERSKPAARWWHHSADHVAYIMQKKHLGNVQHICMPPSTEITRTTWGTRHAFDFFFSQPAEKYRIIREEVLDGRSLVVVDVTVPIDPNSPTRLAYRGWLDLKRGALPLKVYYRQNYGEAPKDQFDRWQPNEIVTTEKVYKLPNGAFYPSKTVCEEWEPDADAPEPTKAEWEEVRVGKRKQALVVHRRKTWDCSVVEIKKLFDDGFFVIPFPPGQNLNDHDARKIVGALDKKSLVKVGQQAPPLSIAQWLDGKPRTLADLKGQIVVLSFCDESIEGMRSSIPRLKAVQDKFRDRPVTFISVHSAKQDAAALADQIREFKTQNQWNFTAGIDSGDMRENSATLTAYGIQYCPALVIIGADSKIAYVEHDLDEPDCDEEDREAVAKLQQKCNDLMKQKFQAVGEAWPIPDGLNVEQQSLIHARVEAAFLTLQIEQACRKAMK